MSHFTGAVHQRVGAGSRQVAVILVGLLLTAVACYAVRAREGVYWAEVDVYFLAPVNSVQTNRIAYTTGGVIATAGLIAHLVDPSSYLSGTQAGLLARGVRNGDLVRLPDSGSQWASNFDQPLLDVQVVSSNPTDVVRRIDRLVAKIHANLDHLQRGTPRANSITLIQSPTVTQVHYAAGDPHRAVGGTLLLGVSVTLLTSLKLRSRPLSRDPGTEKESLRKTEVRTA